MDSRRLSPWLFALANLIVGLTFFIYAVQAGRADHAPLVFADGTVVHGEWGLYRAGHMVPWAEGPIVISAPRFGMGQYFPTNRDDPGAYRRRPPVDRQPIAPEPYFRTWGVQSQNADPGAATVYAPFEPPAVIYAPQFPPHKGKK